MAIVKLPVNFRDDIIDTTVNSKRRYLIEDNSDGTKSLDDVTTYEQVGSMFGAEQINATNRTVNELIEATSNIDNTPDNEKRVAYAETAGTADRALKADNAKNAEKSKNSDNATSATRATHAETADNATNAVNAQMAESAKGVENNFVLRSQAELTFNNSNICTITDNRIKDDSLADVYFTKDTILSAEKAVITVETYMGRVELTAGRRPEGTVKASIVIRTV